MPTASEAKQPGLLARTLQSGARPFLYRAGIRARLGVSTPLGEHLRYPGARPPVGFHYVAPETSRESAEAVQPSVEADNEAESSFSTQALAESRQVAATASRAINFPDTPAPAVAMSLSHSPLTPVVQRKAATPHTEKPVTVSSLSRPLLRPRAHTAAAKEPSLATALNVPGVTDITTGARLAALTPTPVSVAASTDAEESRSATQLSSGAGMPTTPVAFTGPGENRQISSSADTRLVLHARTLTGETANTAASANPPSKTILEARAPAPTAVPITRDQSPHKGPAQAQTKMPGNSNATTQRVVTNTHVTRRHAPLPTLSAQPPASASASGQREQGDARTATHRAEREPSPTIIVQRVSAPNSAPRAFWERSYLPRRTRWRGR